MAGQLTKYPKKQASTKLTSSFSQVGFNVAGNEQRKTYKPIFEYQLPGDEKHTVQIDGNVIKEVNGPITKYQFEGISIKLPSSQEPIAIQGFFSNQVSDTTECFRHNKITRNFFKDSKNKIEITHT